MAVKKAETKKAPVKKAEVKKVEEKKVEKCECSCDDCKCGSNTCLLKSIFYTAICIFVCTAITAIFTIILAIDYHNNGKNNNTNNSNGGSNTGTETNTGTGDEAEYDVSMFEEINVEQLINLYNGEEKSLIYIGRPTCGYCVAFLPSLQQAQEELGYKTYYYDLTNVTEDEYAQITGLNAFMAENFGYTPMVIVVQNGAILSTDGSGEGWVGYSDYDTFKAYLQGLGY